MGELSDQLPGVSEAGPETTRDGSPLRRARTYAGEVVRAIPIVQWAPAYRKRWLRPDVLAALAVWAVLVPQALAYASLAGVPAQAGLYAALAALLLYAIFGTSRELNVGPSSAIAALSAVAVAPLAGGDTATFVALSAMSAVLTGGILVAAGVGRFGFLAEFFAKPVLTGFITGLALTIAMSQAPKLFGVTTEDGNFFEDTWRLAGELDDASLTTFAVGASAIVVLVVLSRLVPKLPAGLIVLVVSIAVSTALDLEAEGVSVVGDIPRGLPPFGWPDVSLAQVLDLVPAAAGIAILAFGESVGGGRALAEKKGYEIDANKELIALGAANVGSGVSQGFVVDGSLSRSAVGDSAGVKSQLSSILGAALVLATLFVLAPLFKNLPNAVLAAIVIVAVAGLVNIKELKRLYRLDLRDFGLALLCLIGVLLLGILPGLLTAIVASLLALVFRAYRPSSAVLGRVPGVESDDAHLFRNIDGHPEYETYPGLVIFRFDNELFFANSHGFREQIRALVRDASPPVHEVIVDASAMNYADTTATDMLNELVAELRDRGVQLTFARAKRPFAEILRVSGVEEAIGADHVHVSLRGAVNDFLGRHPDARLADSP